MPWQRFAKDCFGHIVDIYNVSDAYIAEHGNESFTCLECGQAMLSKRGNIRDHHFAHVAGKKVKCSYESYLHKLGILKFIESYENQIKTNGRYILEIATGNTCHHGKCPYGEKEPCQDITGYKALSLLPTFNKVEREVRDGDFIPDILLTSADDRKIYVEIAVTHFSEPSKFRSGIPIVEIHLKSEEDLKIFENDFLSQRNELVNMFNFDKDMKKINHHCERPLQIAKDQLKNNFQNHVRNRRPLNIHLDITYICNREDCPYIENHCCQEEYRIPYDIAANCSELRPETEYGFSPDYYLTFQKTCEKLRFNFCYRLSSNADAFNGEKTIQFALLDASIMAWRSDNFYNDKSYDSPYPCETRFFNFPSHIPVNLCEKGPRQFNVVIHNVDGSVIFPGIMSIEDIHREIQDNRDKIEDYILLPLKGGQGELPCSQQKIAPLFKKNCDVCINCDDKKCPGVGRIQMCKLSKRLCHNENAQTCEHFKRNLKIKNGHACSLPYREFEEIIIAWQMYRLKLE